MRNYSNVHLLDERLVEEKYSPEVVTLMISVQSLWGACFFPNLRSLKLWVNKISGVGIQKLLDEFLPKLEELYLNKNKISDEGMRVLVTAKNLPMLRILNVGHNSISARGLISMPYATLHQLKELSQCGNKIGSAGSKLMIKAQFLMLQILRMEQCRLGNEGARYLAKGNWPNLTDLNLYSNKMGCDAYSSIASNNNWKQMRQTSICWEEGSATTIASLLLAYTIWPRQSRMSCWIQKSGISENAKNALQVRFNQH